MKKGECTDKGLIVDILTQSFEANQSVNYIIKQDEKRIERILALMDYSIDICVYSDETDHPIPWQTALAINEENAVIGRIFLVTYCKSDV